MRRKIAYLFKLIVFNLAAFPAHAQLANTDSVTGQPFYLKNIQQYYNSIKENAPLFNGAEYTGHGQGIIGHAFFESEIPFKGSIEYDGVIYNNVFLRYDMADDAVIVKDYTGNYSIKLNSKKIRSFVLDQAVFIQPVFYNIAGEGFFQQLHQGVSTVLVKRKKQLNYKTTTEKTIISFQQSNSYYIKKDQRFQPVKSKKDILFMYADKKNEIRKFIGDHTLNFRKKPEQMLVQVDAY